MSWTGNASNSCPRYADYQDAVTNSELQWVNGVEPTGYSASSTLTRNNVDADVNVSATPAGGAGGGLATKAQVEAVRIWDPGINSDTPVIGTPTWDSFQCSVTVPVTDDADIPSWAQGDTEIALERSLAGAGLFSEVATAAYGSDPVDTTAAASTSYDYRVRYRQVFDTSQVGPYSSTANITTGTCDEPA